MRIIFINVRFFLNKKRRSYPEIQDRSPFLCYLFVIYAFFSFPQNLLKTFLIYEQISFIPVYASCSRTQSTSFVVLSFSRRSGSSNSVQRLLRISRCSSPIPAIPNTSCAFSAPKSTPSGYCSGRRKQKREPFSERLPFFSLLETDYFLRLP